MQKLNGLIKTKVRNQIHICECCGEEGAWREGGELGASGKNIEECERMIDDNTGYYCDECWQEILHGE